MARQPLPKDTELRGRYRVDTVLGAGGFGITYVGLDLHLNRNVAIKEYFPSDHAQREGHYSVRSLDSGNRQFFALGRTWFLREARTLAKYHHPNIVGVMDHFEEHGTAYMILRFEDGQKLSSWLRALGRLPDQFEVDGFLLPILSALETMHLNNDMHRDVAMDNIILRPTGDPVLIDFGSARQAIGAHSRSIDAVVKFGYSPPEQYSVDARLQGPWSDVYALASTLHLAITGKLPPDAPGRQLDDNYEPLAESDLQGYRIGLLEGIDWGLALRPAERPQTISQWRRVLLQSSDQPLDEDPVELLNARDEPRTGSGAGLRTQDPGTQAHGTQPQGGGATESVAGTVFVSPTQAAQQGARRLTGTTARSRSGSGTASTSAPPGNRTPASGRPNGTQPLSRRAQSHPSGSRSDGGAHVAETGDALPDAHHGGRDAQAFSASHDGTASRPSMLGAQSGHLDLALLVAAALCAILFFKSSGQSAASLTKLQTALVSGYGLSLAGLIGRHLFHGDVEAARPRAMLALGLVWLPTVFLSVFALPFLGMAFAMRGGLRPWHATALNVAGGLHILVGVLLLFALQESPMFVLASSLSLIGLGFLTLLTTRTSSDVTS